LLIGDTHCEDSEPILLAEMLAAEHAHLHRHDVGGSAESGAAQTGSLDEVYAALHRCGHSALCLSGGGIRSASFALGVLEGLARQGLLRGFRLPLHGVRRWFAGGWLAGCCPMPDRAAPTRCLHNSARSPVRRLGRARAGRPDACRQPVHEPGDGHVSADMWTLIATIIRNIFLNWLVILPLLAAVLLLPHLYLALVQQFYQPVQPLAKMTLNSATAILLVSGVAHRDRLRFHRAHLPSYGNARGDQHKFLIWSLLPLCLGAVGLTLFWTMENFPVTLGGSALLGAAAGGGTWTAVGLLARTRRWRPRTSIGAAWRPRWRP